MLSTHTSGGIFHLAALSRFSQKLSSDLPTKSCSDDIYIPSPHLPWRGAVRGFSQGNPQTRPALNGKSVRIPSLAFLLPAQAPSFSVLVLSQSFTAKWPIRFSKQMGLFFTDGGWAPRSMYVCVTVHAHLLLFCIVSGAQDLPNHA